MTIIDGGALVAWTMSLGAAPADDDHAIIIRDGGTLVVEPYWSNPGSETPFQGRKIILDGGTLEGTTPAESIEVRRPSTISGQLTEVRGDLSGTGDLVLDCFYEGEHSTAGMAVTGSLNDLEGDLYVTGFRVGISGNNSGYDGDVFVSAEQLSPTGSSRIS